LSIFSITTKINFQSYNFTLNNPQKLLICVVLSQISFFLNSFHSSFHFLFLFIYIKIKIKNQKSKIKIKIKKKNRIITLSLGFGLELNGVLSNTGFVLLSSNTLRCTLPFYFMFSPTDSGLILTMLWILSITNLSFDCILSFEASYILRSSGVKDPSESYTIPYP
jgi:hypothetical protein